MARFTSLEFLEALGLTYGDYNGAKILLRLLQKKGIATEVGKISPTGRGRPQTVYELPDEITIGVKPPDFVPSHPVKKKKPKVEEPPTDEGGSAEEALEEIYADEVEEIYADEVEDESDVDEEVEIEEADENEVESDEEELVEASYYEWGEDDDE